MRYRSSTGAYKWLLDHGADGLWDFVDNYFERIPLVMAGRGDLIAHKTTDESLGVCLGEFYGTPSDNGVLFVAMSDAEFAWRIK